MNIKHATVMDDPTGATSIRNCGKEQVMEDIAWTAQTFMTDQIVKDVAKTTTKQSMESVLLVNVIQSDP